MVRRAGAPHQGREPNSASDFRHYYAAARDTTPEEYEQYVGERMERTGRVAGAFDIDLDAETFASLDSGGWSQHAVRDVRTAAYRADRKSNESPDDRLAKLLGYLQGRELTQPSQDMAMGQSMC